MSKPEQVFEAQISGERLQFCCGVHETGEYEIYVEDRYYHDGRSGEKIDRLEQDGDFFDTLREAWMSQLEKVRKEAGARPIVFTFAKYKGEKQFSNKELYDLVVEQEDHLFVHGFTNPSSGSYVEMWVLTNGSKK